MSWKKAPDIWPYKISNKQIHPMWWTTKDDIRIELHLSYITTTFLQTYSREQITVSESPSGRYWNIAQKQFSQYRSEKTWTSSLLINQTTLTVWTHGRQWSTIHKIVKRKIKTVWRIPTNVSVEFELLTRRFQLLSWLLLTLENKKFWVQ